MELSSHYYLGTGITVNLHWLADDLADKLNDDALIELILRMDLRKADLHFTSKLYAVIGDELRNLIDPKFDDGIPDHLYSEQCPKTCCGGNEDA